MGVTIALAAENERIAVDGNQDGLLRINSDETCYGVMDTMEVIDALLTEPQRKKFRAMTDVNEIPKQTFVGNIIASSTGDHILDVKDIERMSRGEKVETEQRVHGGVLMVKVVNGDTAIKPHEPFWVAGLVLDGHDRNQVEHQMSANGTAPAVPVFHRDHQVFTKGTMV